MEPQTHNGAKRKVILDTRDQLVTASRTNGPNGAADAAYNYSYSFDEVGNRTNEIRGQQEGPFGRTLKGTFNSLNQIRTRLSGGRLPVVGTVDGTSSYTVKVDGTNAVLYANGSTNFLGGALLDTGSNQISVVTVDTTISTTSETTFVVYAPPTQPQVFTWDKNGNLTSDGLRDYVWSEENRCTNIETSAAAVSMGLPKLKSEYVFDGLGRRVETRDYSDWNGSDYSTTNITRFVWDGFNVLAVLNEDNSIRSYVVRGLDLSQSLQGAGGIGGILAMHHQGTNYLYTADGNGNITEVTDDQGTVVASYVYSPFGKLISSSGSFASENPWLFSSQWYEPQHKHYRYVYRIYLPDIGWASKDPFAHIRYAGLYKFVQNAPLTYIDPSGRQETETERSKKPSIPPGTELRTDDAKQPKAPSDDFSSYVAWTFHFVHRERKQGLIEAGEMRTDFAEAGVPMTLPLVYRIQTGTGKLTRWCSVVLHHLRVRAVPIIGTFAKQDDPRSVLDATGDMRYQPWIRVSKKGEAGQFKSPWKRRNAPPVHTPGSYAYGREVSEIYYFNYPPGSYHHGQLDEYRIERKVNDLWGGSNPELYLTFTVKHEVTIPSSNTP